MKSLRQVLLSFLIVFFLPARSPAQNDLDRMAQKLSNEMELSDLLEYAYLSNPSVTASKESWQVFIENYRIGTSYPDPQLMTTFFPKPIETRLGPQDWNLTLSQAIPFPGTLSQKGKLLEADIKISKLKLDKTIKTMVTTVASAYHELLYIQKAVQVAKFNLALNQKLMKICESAYAQDKALFYDVSKARAQTAQIQYDIILLQELEDTEKIRINTLLNRLPHAKLGRAAPLPQKEVVYSLDEIFELAALFQEDILIAEETVIKSEEAIRLSRYENLPTFKLGLFYAGIGNPDLGSVPKDAGDDAVGIQLGLNLPLWFGKNNSRVARAKALKTKAKAEKSMVANQTRAAISRLWFKLQNSKRLIALYQNNLLPQAQAAVHTAETWFRQSKGSFSDFLEVQATAYNFELSLERAKTDYGKALVQLEQLAGVILDKSNQLPSAETDNPEQGKGDTDK